MNITEQLSLQIDRVIKKVADKFPASQEASVLTDVHFCVNQDTGEMTVLDDDDNEITRCVVEQWIDDKSDDFYEQVAMIMRGELKKHANLLESMSILKLMRLFLKMTIVMSNMNYTSLMVILLLSTLLICCKIWRKISILSLPI